MMQRSDEHDEEADIHQQCFAEEARGQSPTVPAEHRGTGGQSGGLKRVARLLDHPRRGFGAGAICSHEVIDRVGEMLALPQPGEGIAPARARRREEGFQMIEERRPGFFVEMHDQFLQSPIDLSSQIACGLTVVAAAAVEPRADVDRLPNPDPDRAAELFLAPVVDAEGNELEIRRAFADGLNGDAGGTTFYLLNSRRVVALALGKDPDSFAQAETSGSKAERFEVAMGLGWIIAATVGGHHAERVQDVSEDWNLEQRRLRQEPHGPLRHQPDHHGIHQGILVIRRQQQRAVGGKVVSSGNLDAGIVNARQTAHGPSRQPADPSVT